MSDNTKKLYLYENFQWIESTNGGRHLCWFVYSVKMVNVFFFGIHLPLCLSKCPYRYLVGFNNTKEENKEKGRV